MWKFWLIASGVFFIGEIFTVGFLIFWFGIGALLTMIASFFITNIFIQAVIFVISSTILLLLTKPIINKFVSKKTVATNVYEVIGKKGIVTQEINSTHGKGQVKVGNEIWTAVSSEILPLNTEIEVEKIEGVKLIVKSTSKEKQEA